MHRDGIDALLLTGEENVAYFSGYRVATIVKSAAPCLIIPADDSPRSVLSVGRRGNYEVMSSVDQVHYCVNPESGFTRELERLTSLKFSKGRLNTTIEELKSAGLSNKIIGVELGEGMRMGLCVKEYQGIKSGLPNATFVDAGNLIWELRMIKSPSEVQYIKKACEVACKGFQIGFNSLREGMSEREFARAVYKGFLDAGSEDNPLEMCLNIRAGWDRYVMSSTRPTDRILKKGDIIVIDNGGRLYRGYNADIARAGCVGQPSPKQKELFDIARQAQEVGINRIKAGVPASRVYADVADFIKKAGYERYTLYEGMGHGVGLDMHEPPHFDGSSDMILKSGMVVSMEPCIYDAPLVQWMLQGIVAPSEGVFFLEDDILVTDGNPEVLSKLSSDLFIV
jgi:Xaa-Pro dipeptidase